MINTGDLIEELLFKLSNGCGAIIPANFPYKFYTTQEKSANGLNSIRAPTLYRVPTSIAGPVPIDLPITVTFSNLYFNQMYSKTGLMSSNISFPDTPQQSDQP